TVRRQSNPAFVSPLKISRAQIYSDMTPKDFTKNLVVFQDEEVKMARAADGRLAATAGAMPAQPGSASAGPWARDRSTAAQKQRAEELKRGARRRGAPEGGESARTPGPADRKALDARKRLQGRIAQEVAGLLQEGRSALDRGVLAEAQQRFLTALSL